MNDIPSPAISPGQKQTPKLILLLLLLSVSLVPIGMVAIDNYPAIADNTIFLMATLIVLTIAPICGISVVFLATLALRATREKRLSNTLLLRLTQIVGVPAGIGNIVVLLVMLFWLLTYASVGSLRDTMTLDLTNLFENAHRYRLRPDTLRGGNGSYTGYAVHPVLSSNENGSYSAIVLHRDTIEFTALSHDSMSTIKVRLGPDGQPIEPWVYTGFKY